MSKTDDVGVRLAEAADRDKIWPLARAFATTYELDQGRYNASFQQLVAEPNALLIIAHTPVTDIVGYLLAFTHQTFLANGPVTWIEEVMVAEEVRRRGIGHNLMVAAENWSASKGAAYVALATRRASDFYLALGYTESAAYFRKLSEPANKQALGPVRTVPPGPVEVDTASHPIRASDLTDASGASIQTRPRNRYRPGGNLTSAKLSKRSHGHDSSKPAI